MGTLLVLGISTGIFADHYHIYKNKLSASPDFTNEKSKEFICSLTKLRYLTAPQAKINTVTNKERSVVTSQHGHYCKAIAGASTSVHLKDWIPPQDLLSTRCLLDSWKDSCKTAAPQSQIS